MWLDMGVLFFLQLPGSEIRGKILGEIKGLYSC